MVLVLSKIPAVLRGLRKSLTAQIRREMFQHEMQRRFPLTHFEWPLTFVVDDYCSLYIGSGCWFGPYSEITVLKRSLASTVPGSLSVEGGTSIGMSANIRAAGGAIRIGQGTKIAQHVSLVASNHMIDKTTAMVLHERWDEARTGITIGDRCWIGAGAIILPGVIIGSGSVIGAGSVVTKPVGERQIWHGNPAKYAKTL